jgi:hypothetical protein
MVLTTSFSTETKCENLEISNFVSKTSEPMEDHKLFYLESRHKLTRFHHKESKKHENSQEGTNYQRAEKIKNWSNLVQSEKRHFSSDLV